LDGVSYAVAAGTVADALPEAYFGLRRGRDPLTHGNKKGQSEHLAKKLKEMYRTINEKQAGDPDSALLAIMDTTRKMLNDTAGSTSPKAEEFLQEQYILALEMAQLQLDRLR
jgi:hypothetical protein